MEEFEKKYPYIWLILGLLLTMLSYGIFNTGICAWIFAIPLLRYINNRTKWSSILNFINSNGELLNTYMKNHLVPVVEEPKTERGDGKTPVIEVDGVKYTYLICAIYSVFAILSGFVLKRRTGKTVERR